MFWSRDLFLKIADIDFCSHVLAAACLHSLCLQDNAECLLWGKTVEYSVEGIMANGI